MLLWILSVVLIFCNKLWPSSSVNLWGGEQLSIVGSDIVHVTEMEDKAISEAQFIRSREFLLPSEQISYSNGDTVVFNLFDGDIISGIVEQCFHRDMNDATWSGSIYEDSHSSSSIGQFSLTCVKDSCVGQIYLWSTGQEYHIKPLIKDGQGGAATLMKVNKRFVPVSIQMLPPDESHQLLDMQNSKNSLRGVHVAAVDTDLILDICMLYTNEALADFSGSVSAITAAIQGANDQTNVILANSAISLRYRIVCIKKVSDTFSENGNTISTLLSQLTNLNDGYLNEAQTYRESFQADFVGLVVSKVAGGSGTCGVGWVNGNFLAQYSYGAYRSDCLSGGRTYAHEIGHTMGCQHDRITALQSDPNFIAYGNCWEDASKTDCTCYKSVLVYQCNTPQNQCTSCSQKPYMANPNVVNAGNPTGLANAACGLVIHNNRLKPIAYRQSVQPGGMIFSVNPSAAVYSTCNSVNITGWQLLRDLNDVPTVTINGISVNVISYDMNSVQVKSQVASAPSGAGSVIVSGSQSGRVTTLPNAFTLLPTQSVYNESFSSGTITGTKWSSIGVQPWIVDSVGIVKTDGSSSPDGASAILQYSALTASPQRGSCSEVISSLSFSYWAYSRYDFCYGPFTVQVQTFGSSTWTSLVSKQGQSNSGSTPYISVSVAIPSNVQRIILKAETSLNTNCIFFTPVKVKQLSVKSTYTCNANLACGNIAAGTSNPTNRPSVRPSAASTKGSTTAPTTRPSSAAPTKVPSAAPTKRPSARPTAASITAAPTKGPSVRPSAGPTVVPKTSMSPTKRPSSGPSAGPTAAPKSASPTKRPSSGPSAGPTAAPKSSASPTTRPSSGPSARPTVAPITAAPTKRPSSGPSAGPTAAPKSSASPTKRPTSSPSASPTKRPSSGPSAGPTVAPKSSASPTKRPSSSPSASPTKRPSSGPSAAPTKGPIATVTLAPTKSPTRKPSIAPTLKL